MAVRFTMSAVLLALGVACSRGNSEAPGQRPPASAMVVRSDPLDGARGAAPGRSNVVLVIGCTVRRDQVSPYGGPPHLTPNLTSLAASGARLEDVVAAAPWTRASSAALLTGRHALELGLAEPGAGRNDRALPEEALTLAERLRDAGYVTVGATANPNLNDSFGFVQGFDHYLQPRALWRDGQAKLRGTALVPELLESLDTQMQPDRPIYLQVLLVDAHSPYDEADTIPPGPGVPPADVQRYRIALANFDHAVGALKQGLRAKGLTDENTYFVVTSDHGEGLSWPAHHGRGHGRYLYSSAVDAIGLVSGPGLEPGRTVGGVASGLDLTPTVLGLVGVEGYRGSGIDLTPALKGLQADTGRKVAISDTWFSFENRAAIFTSSTVCMRSFATEDRPAPSGRFVPGCYDRSEDPNQIRPIAEDVDLLSALSAWRAKHTSGTDSVPSVSVDPALAKQLEALGYVDSEP